MTVHLLFACLSGVFLATFNICAGLTLLAASASLWAHHSPSAIFDMKNPISLKGTVTKVDWVNPHIVLYMDVKGDDGNTVSWKCESNPPKWFSRVGVNRADFAAAIGPQSRPVYG
jgi:hypothetical protein